MRISDWSSDVCSSDLDDADARLPPARLREIQPLVQAINSLADARAGELELARHRAADLAHGLKTPLAALAAQSRGTEERRVGTEWVRTCRYRWLPHNLTKTTEQRQNKNEAEHK